MENYDKEQDKSIGPGPVVALLRILLATLALVLALLIWG